MPLADYQESSEVLMNTNVYKEPVKLIALDLDRTTLKSDGHISKANRQAVEYAISKGIHVCIASGRAFDTLPLEVVTIPGIEYAITSNGAAVYKIKDKKCLNSYVLKESSVAGIIKNTARYPVTYEAFIRGKAYASKEYIADPVKFGATPKAIEYVRSTRTLQEDIVSFIYEHKHELDSIDIVLDDDELKNRIIRELYEKDPDIYITSSVKQLIEISYKDAGKKSGVRFLADRLGIDRKNIAAFGDADNDCDMIEFAGAGVAMGNACDALKEAADYITLSNDDDGLAYAIYNILHI